MATMTTENEQQARELLKRLTAKLEAIGEPEWRTVTKEAREYLERTEPAHPVVKAIQDWWEACITRFRNEAGDESICKGAAYAMAMHFYRKALEDAAGMIADPSVCVECNKTRQRILDAAGKVPEGVNE